MPSASTTRCASLHSCVPDILCFVGLSRSEFDSNWPHLLNVERFSYTVRLFAFALPVFSCFVSSLLGLDLSLVGVDLIGIHSHTICMSSVPTTLHFSVQCSVVSALCLSCHIVPTLALCSSLSVVTV